MREKIFVTKNERKAVYNSTFAKGGISCSKEIQIAIRIGGNEPLAFQPDSCRDKFFGKSLALRVVAKR